MKTTKAKSFNAVRMKRLGAIGVRRATRGLTAKEELEFWRKETAALRRRQRALRKSVA